LRLHLAAARFEHAFKGEFALRKLLHEFSVVMKSLDRVRLPHITGLLLADCRDKSAEVKDLSLDPVSDMNERILKFLGQQIKLVLEV